MIKSLIKKFVPAFLLDWYHFLLAFLGAVVYRFPSKKLKVVGVTGTNGKTTTTEMILKILEEAGCKVALMNSIRFKIGEKEWTNILKMTMPGRLKLQKFLRQAANEGCRYVVLEVTSEGIKQHRHCFIGFAAAVFTNLSPEHIESHGSFENYRAAKGKLFKAAKDIHIVNVDDKNAEYFLGFPAGKKYTYGLDKGDVNRKNTDFQLSLMGDFNIYNALAAISVGLSQGIPLETCQKAVESVKEMPGRMEMVITYPFKVIVDYAVTPDALEGLYKTLKRDLSPNNLVCVFGACGGGRDKWKREALGRIAQNYCDKIILTNEDPYDENPNRILSEIESGISNFQFPISKILDRREAIKRALSLVSSGDVVALTGKGCEPQMALAQGKKIPWDDRKVVKEEYEKIRNSRT